MISSSHAHDNKTKVLVGSCFGAYGKGRKGVWKQANAASEQTGWSCPPKVGGRAKRRGYETKAKQHVKLQKFIPLTATRSSPTSGEQHRPDGP